MKGAILLSAEDQLKLDILAKVESGVMDRGMASLALDVTDRTLRRYLKEYRDKGICSVFHGNRGRSPSNKTDEALKLKIQSLIKTKYFDFNMLHALEKINQELDINLKREVFRKWSHEIGVVKRSRKRRKRVRKYRSRMKRSGILIQMDGSHHRWFAGLETCLIAAIDDATGEIVGAEFFYGETSEGCLKVLRDLVGRKGVFELLYVDKAGVFGGIKRSGFSQVERALGELGSKVIYANSPEAKGRIERLFDTLQDRLVAEMRLAGVKNIRQANKFLQEIYIPHQHNPRFSSKPESPITAYRPVPDHLDLDEVFCKKEYRRVAKDHTISFSGSRFILDRQFPYSIAGQKIEIRIYGKGRWIAFYGEEKMKLVIIKKLNLTAA